jgi:DtxR family Mn-dependent transcriptional regulator
MKNELTESLEKYLLAIYEIVKINKAARVKDVSNYLKIGGPATSDAVKTLASRKYINYVPYGIITITAKGKRKAEEKITRHKIISNFLEKVLLIPHDHVFENAKQIEYSMSQEVLERFLKFLTFMEKCPTQESEWVKNYKHFIQKDEMTEDCQACVSKNKKTKCATCK